MNPTPKTLEDEVADLLESRLSRLPPEESRRRIRDVLRILRGDDIRKDTIREIQQAILHLH